nr:hypothetical protein [Tanacetum cinerariifolium]
MKRIVNVQGVIDKCTGPLTLTATRIMESIKKEAHLIKVQWNGANKYQVSGSLGDQCVVDAVSMTCSCRKWELTRIPCKHDVAACWNMALNDRAAPPPETWAICKGQGRKAPTGGNNAESSGSTSRQAQQIEPAVGQDGSGGSGVGVVIGLSVVAGEGGAGDPGGAGVASQGSSHTRWTRRRVQTKRISP